MSKNEIDYSSTIIYKIVCTDLIIVMLVIQLTLRNENVHINLIVTTKIA